MISNLSNSGQDSESDRGKAFKFNLQSISVRPGPASSHHLGCSVLMEMYNSYYLSANDIQKRVTHLR